ncbi:MAG: hypothetical protein SGBAC_011388 [Bacillariaceae sp.]
MSSPAMVAGDHIAPQQQAGQSERKPRCKDPFFAVLLYLNVAAIIGIAATMGKDALTSVADGGSIYDYSGFIYAGVVISLMSLVFAGIALLIVMKFPETMIKMSLIFVVILAGISALMAFVAGSVIGGVVGLLFFAFSVWLCGVEYLSQASGFLRRENGDAGILASLSFHVGKDFNKWAFVYVGVYGYGYIEAGKNVIQLFKNRGWEAIIADDLVGNVVMLMSIVTGAFMGGIAVLLESSTDWFSSVPSDAPIFAFILGFILGTAITAILLSTMASGVNAVIVMFADAPEELERNYPEISRNMREKWNEVYPGSV